jgi:predicted nucleic acid-binding Zn ribbon protein
MPVYCFRCARCGNRYEFVGNYSKLKNKTIVCLKCRKKKVIEKILPAKKTIQGKDFIYPDSEYDQAIMYRDFQAEGMTFHLKGQCWSADYYNRNEQDRQRSYVQSKQMLPEEIDTGYPREEDYEPKIFSYKR